MKAWRPAVGDRIVNTGWGRGTGGTIVKIGRGQSVIVRFDGRDEDERVRLDCMRAETAADVAKRAHEQAMREWTSKRPRTNHTGVQSTSYMSSDPSAVHILGALRSPSEMRAASDELRLMADWFEQRPEGPNE
jgi:hypothetical protein